MESKFTLLRYRTLKWASFAIAGLAMSMSSYAQSDSCHTATVVTAGSYTADGPSSGAAANNAGATNADWYSFTAPANGVIDIDACADPGDTDTRLFVYKDGCGVLTQVVTNDDACNTSGYSSEVTGVAVTSGTTYHIEWDDRLSTNGFDWTLAFTPITCPDPTNFAVVGVTSTTFEVEWNSSNMGATYLIEYGSPGFSHGFGTLVGGTVDSDPDTASNVAALTANTTYDVYLREVCSVGDSSNWLGPISVTTLCNAVSGAQSEDFSGGTLPTCWTTLSSGDGWQISGGLSPDWGLVNDHTTGTTANGNVAWIDGSVGPGHVADHQLNSPLVDVSGLTNPEVTFWVHSSNNTNNSYVTLHVNVWDGAMWNADAIVLDTATTGSTWEEFTIDLTGYTITGPVQIQFVVDETTLGGNFQNDLAIDDFSIQSVTSADIGVVGFTAPADGCGLSASEGVAVWVENLGAGTITTGTTVNMEYRVDGGSVVADSVSLSSDLDPGDSLSFTFSVGADLSSLGAHTIEAWTALTADIVASNDSSSTTVTNTLVSTFPYTEDFDSFTPDNATFAPFAEPNPNAFLNGWINQSGDGADWYARSVATGSGGTGPDQDHTSGAGNYVFVEDGSNNNPGVGLILPCLDLTQLSGGAALTYWVSSFNNGGAGDNYLLVDVWDGSTWTQVDSVGSLASIDWEKRIVLLNAFTSDTVNIRWSVNNANANFEHDIAIDDVSILSPPVNEIGAVGIVQPAQIVCGSGAGTTSVEIQLANFGFDTLAMGTTIDVAYSVSGNAAVSEGFSLAADWAPGDTINYTFTTVADFSVSDSMYLLDVWSEYSLETDMTNDSVLAYVVAHPALDLGPDSTVCPGDSVTLDAGAIYDSYTWSTGDTTQTITVGAAGQYYVDGVINGACTQSDTVEIFIHNVVAMDLGMDQVLCPGDSVMLTTGTGFSPVLWNSGSSNQDITVYDLQDTVDVELRMYDSFGDGWNGAAVTFLQGSTNLGSFSETNSPGDSTVVNFSFLPENGGPIGVYWTVGSFDGEVSFVLIDTLAGDTLIDQGANPLGGAPGGTTNILTGFPYGSGNYVALGIDTTTGCISSDTVAVTFAPPTVDLGPDTSICIGSPIMLDAGLAGSYSWNTGDTTQTIMADTGTYIVDISNGPGCTGSDTIVIGGIAPPSVSTSGDAVACVGDSVLATATGADTYQWFYNDTLMVSSMESAGTTLDDSDTTLMFLTVYGTDTTTGCMAVDTHFITVNALPIVDLGPDTSFCDGGSIVLDAGAGFSSFLWGTGDTTQMITETMGGTYTVAATDGNGCVGNDTVMVSMLSIAMTADSVSICSGDSVMAGGSMQTMAGVYSDTLTGSNGCDSIHTRTVMLLMPTTGSATASICPGDSIMLGGAMQTMPGTYVDTLVGSNTCDSIVTTTLSYIAPSTSSATAWICPGDSIMLGGAMQTMAGMYVDTLTGSNGCDSIITTTLSMYPTYSETDSVQMCAGDSVFVGGAFQTMAGTYNDTMSTANGCDSVVMTVLSVVNSLTTNLTVAICDGDSVFAGGAYQTTSGVYVDSLTASAGCDSVVTTTLTVNSLPTVNAGADINTCENDSVFSIATGASTYIWTAFGDTISTTAFVGGTIDTSGAFVLTVEGTDANGCVATDMMTITATAAPTVDLGADQALCDGGTVTLDAGAGFNSYAWSDMSTMQTLMVTTTGMYSVSVTDSSGCTGIDDVMVTFWPSYSDTNTVQICTGDSIFVGGAFQTASGTYIDSLTTSNSCDSIIVTVLDVTGTIVTNAMASICDGDSIMLGGAMQTMAGVYNDTLMATAGCDSVVMTTLSVIPTAMTNDTITICTGDSAFIGGAYQTMAGSYVDTLTASTSCDSIVTTVLNVVNTLTTSVDAWICDGDSIMLGGAMQTMAGIYNDTLTAAAGCDSVVTTTLMLWPTFDMMDTVWICDGGVAVIGGMPQTAAGTYVNSYSSANGCDSTVTTELIVWPSFNMMVSDSICEGDSIFLAGAWQTMAGSYTDSLTTMNGCDSLITTSLTVIPSPDINLGNDMTLCSGDSTVLDAGAGFASYMWSPGNETSQTITVSTAGTYSVVAANAGACSSTGSIVISVGSNPNVSVTPASSTICDGESTVLTASGAGGAGTYSWTPATGLSSTTGDVVTASPSATTSYIVTGTNSSGCSATDTAVVTVNGLPSLSATQSSGGAPVCINEEDTITITSSATDFIWFLPTGQLNTQNTEVVIAVEETTDIDITALGNGGCNNTITVTVTVDTTCADTTFIPELGLGIEAGSYIVHSTEELVVTLGDGNSGMYQVTVMDAMGSLVHTQAVRKSELSTTYRIDLAGEAGGVYILRVDSKNGTYVERHFKR